MNFSGVGIFITMVFILNFLSPLRAPAQQPLKIATKEAAPFAIKRPGGQWSGISIELWEQIARELGYSYEFTEMSLADMLHSMETGTADAAVAALTVTPEREVRFDFTHTFYTTGLSVAVPRGGTKSYWQVLRAFISPDFLKAVSALSLLLFITGALVWAVERRRNPQQFGGSMADGLGAGFWWSAVTMTTVGYGDKAPVTFWGRLIALIWMFMAIIIISGFTAAIASALTVNRLQSRITGEDDLRRVRVATVEGSTSQVYLQHNNIGSHSFGDIQTALRAVARGNVDALVYDAPILRYLVKTSMSDSLEVLPFTFSRQDYGIGLPAGSPLREPVNRVLLKVIREPAWEQLLQRYLGK